MEIEWNSTNFFITKNKCYLKKCFASHSYNFFKELVIMEFKNAVSLSEVG